MSVAWSGSRKADGTGASTVTIKTGDRTLSDPATLCLPNTTVDEPALASANGHIPSSRCRFRIERDLAPHRCKRLLIRTMDATASEILAPKAAEMDHDDGGDRRDRTDDLMLAKHALSQLSYVPKGRIANGE